MTLVQDIVDVLKQLAPLHLAESWDNVGLLLGDNRAVVQKIMTCLTITPEVVHEAVREKVGLIVSHHPLLFSATQRITTETNEGRMLLSLMAHHIAVYSAHTAYDNASGGINDQLAQALNLTSIRPLSINHVNTQAGNAPSTFKIVVFVPETDLAKVSEAAFKADAGVYGRYKHCSFRSSGTGTFFGMTDTHPTIGQAGRSEEVTEYRLEFVCTFDKLSAAVAAIEQAHSYETPVIDVYPLFSHHQNKPDIEGSGRIGELPSPITASALAEQVAQLLKTPVTLTGAVQNKVVKSLAIVCGAGGSMLAKAIEAGADALLTGEIRFHDELAAQAAGVTVIAAGHYATERPGMEALACQLAEKLPSCKAWASCAEHNPAQYIPYKTLTSSG
jgi:dinuclear metal center YbgI/SA1388 family protein